MAESLHKLEKVNLCQKYADVLRFALKFQMKVNM